MNGQNRIGTYPGGVDRSDLESLRDELTRLLFKLFGIVERVVSNIHVSRERIRDFAVGEET